MNNIKLQQDLCNVIRQTITTSLNFKYYEERLTKNYQG